MALTGLMYIDSIENMEDYDSSMTYLVGDEIIDTYVVGDEQYLFLPSWGIVNGGVDTEDIIVMKSENLPSMHIWTDSGSVDKIWNDKEAFETGRLSIYDAQGEKLYSGGLKNVNTRGNYSFTNYLRWYWAVCPSTCPYHSTKKMLCQHLFCNFCSFMIFFIIK